MDIFPQIDAFIQNQWPEWYQLNGSNFIAFVQAYFQWLEEEGNALYYSRNYYNIKDVDTTFDQFLVYFKEKYFLNIQLGTAADIRLLIKKALDLYRAKGTQQGTQLLFQLAYGETPSFYYPGTDLFKLSDGNWFQPKYLELSLSDNNVLLQQQEVIGAQSGAIAFVDAIIRRFTQHKLQDIAYISAIQGGVFQAGERLLPTNSAILAFNECPTLKGSLNGIQISGAGTGINYQVGDIVPITSQNGNNALFLITNTASESVVSLVFDDGGYGYAANANLYTSTVNITLANVTISNTEPLYNNAWNFLDTITEPLASLNYNSANGTFQYGNLITTYYANDSIMGEGYIIGINQTNTSAGQVTVSVISGNVGNNFYTTGNAIGATLNLANGYTNITATGNYIANASNCTVIFNNLTSGPFLVGEEVISLNPDRAVVWGSGFVSMVSNTNVTLQMEKGIIYSNNQIIGQTSMAQANVVSVSTQIGLINVFNSFIASNLAYCSSNLMTANVSLVQPIVGNVSISLSPALNYSETIQSPTDVIEPYLTLPINSIAYGFPGNPTGNLSHLTIGQILSWGNLTIGEIANTFFLGANLTSAVQPFVVVDQPQISDRKIYDDILEYSNASGTFPIGDVITQGITNARGMVRENSNGSVLYLKRMRYANDFILTTNNSTQLSGLFSGFTANCTNVTFDFDSEPMGRNLQIGVDYSQGNGIIISGKIVDSGFGFVNEEGLTIGANDALGNAIVSNYGTGSGYYANIGGFLSGPKRLFDGVYYQHFSYEIISNLMLNKYQTLVKDITHVAGTALFGRFVWDQTSNTSVGMAQQTFKTGNQYSLNAVSSIVTTGATFHTSNGYGLTFTGVVQAKANLANRSISSKLVFDALANFNGLKRNISLPSGFVFNTSAKHRINKLANTARTQVLTHAGAGFTGSYVWHHANGNANTSGNI
jgi:hypothetical protein